MIYVLRAQSSMLNRCHHEGRNQSIKMTMMTFIHYIGERLKLERETENSGV